MKLTRFVFDVRQKFESISREQKLCPRTSRYVINGKKKKLVPKRTVRIEKTMLVSGIFHVAVRLFSNRSQMTSKCGKNKKVAHEAIAECVTDVLTTF